MLAQQSEHIATVLHVVERGVNATRASAHDSIIRDSWSRCVAEHRLDPTRMQEAVILPGERLREHQDRMEEFLQIARHGLETLYHQVAGLGYCVLLTDARGVTVDFLGDLVFEPSLRKAGLYLGADWSEQVAGTCGVGTCIATLEPLTVHLADHFDATHIPLTCTSAPIFDASGELLAVLDVSQLSSAQPKASQHLALQLVMAHARLIESAAFMRRFRHDRVLRMSGAPQFLDVNPEYLVALDDAGRVIGHNRRAQLLLGGDRPGNSVLGRSIDTFCDASLERLEGFTVACPLQERAIMLTGSARVLFALTAAPTPRVSTQRGQRSGAGALPEPLASLSGGDPVLDRQIERAAKLVNSPISILLLGETGSGKEYFAKAIHASSKRRAHPLIAVNCAAIPESLIESELFGYEAGSFSGARNRGKRGLIQEADGGTLFLDEIGDMALDLQARLLRVLAEREVLPVGATRAIPVDIRVIAATHCDLEARVRDGQFRDDLYYRLNGALVCLPPLRERSDLDWLIDRMLGQLHKAGDRHKELPRLSEPARAILQAHRWPGNLRELRNVIEYAGAVCAGNRIDVADLPDGLVEPDADAPDDDRSLTTDLIPPHTASTLLAQLQAASWNVSAVARQLGVARMTVYRRMHRLGLRSPARLDRPARSSMPD